MNEFLSWYLAPWRKIGRGPFNTLVFAVAVPGMLLWFVGLGESASGVGGMIGTLLDMSSGMQNVANAGGDLTHMANEMMGVVSSTVPMGEAPVAHGFDWGALGGWVDSLLWLLCLPLVRMRVRDMGYANDTVGHWLWVAAAFAGTVPEVLTKLGIPGFESMGTWGSIIAFVGLLVLCVKGPPREPRSEHFIYTPPVNKDLPK
ncbi:MAG TPA: hypothetical protein VHP58_07040 [Alphaproteobacteria bacterium]|nr:hypothetical protein [Alphaproteobacteria bacterium]